MTIAFWLGVAGLVVLAWWMLLPAMRRAAEASPPTAKTENLLILKEQLAALDAELTQGCVDAAEHGHARAEVQRRVLDEAVPAALANRAATGDNARIGIRRSSLALGTGIPVLALALYGVLGNPAALHAPMALASRVDNVSVEAVQAMVDTLAERLQSQPPGQASDAAGWAMLARSYAALQRFSDASSAYAQAIALAPNDAQLLADHADVLAMLQGQRMQGEPARLIERALKHDPSNLKALSLAGSAAFERRDFAAAAEHWNRALDLAPTGSAFAAGLERSLADARAAAGEPPSPAAQAGPGAPARISGSVSLAPALAMRIEPTDTVFVVARAAEGTRMPLAVVRRTAAELPIAFTLDDSMAMSPGLKLSNFAHVVVTARVSRSGNATPQPGDLHGESAPVATRATGLQLTIDGVQR